MSRKTLKLADKFMGLASSESQSLRQTTKAKKEDTIKQRCDKEVGAIRYLERGLVPLSDLVQVRVGR